MTNCKSIIIAHNHPSGDTTPSAEDKEISSMVSSKVRMVSMVSRVSSKVRMVSMVSRVSSKVSMVSRVSRVSRD